MHHLLEWVWAESYNKGQLTESCNIPGGVHHGSLPFWVVVGVFGVAVVICVTAGKGCQSQVALRNGIDASYPTRGPQWSMTCSVHTSRHSVSWSLDQGTALHSYSSCRMLLAGVQFVMTPAIIQQPTIYMELYPRVEPW